MDKRTRTALEGSIAKWQKIVNGGIDEGWMNCPLCAEFADKVDSNEDGLDVECAGCPVRAATGKDGCNGSPYELWTDYQGDKNKYIPFAVFNAKSKRLAQAELDFLISLRPEDKP